MKCLEKNKTWKVFAYISGLEGSGQVNPIIPFVFITLRLTFGRHAWI